MLTISLFCLTGCSHALEVKNLDYYRPEFYDSPALNSSVGIVTSPSTPAGDRLLTATANGLKRNGFRVTYPFFLREDTRKSVDFIVKVTSSSQFKGSGWNFLINWPGFLIWTPAWHGYNYNANFRFDAEIVDTQSGTTENSTNVAIPVELDFRHAAMNRTWTEISWLEWGVIALIGGFVFIRYDKSVTPKLIDSVGEKIGDYVAGKITGTIISLRAPKS